MLRLRPVCLRIVQNGQFIRSKGSSLASSGETSKDGMEAATAQKLRARPPLVKNFFAGTVDKELLAFPEVIDREQMSTLQKHVDQFKHYFQEHLHLQPEVLMQLQQMNAYGLNVPEDYEGKGWQYSASLKASEPESECTDIALSFLPHRIVVDIINELGSLEQQQRLLPQLAKGTLIGTDAMLEYNAADDGFFSTTASYQAEAKCWELNGEKAFVYNGPLADKTAKQLFLVLAQTNSLQVHDSAGFGITAFLVDGSSTGVSVGDVHNSLGARGVQMRRIKFKNVQVTDANVIGTPHDGAKVADMLLRVSRLRASMVALGVAKSTLGKLTQTCLDIRQNGVELAQIESIQMHLSKAACNIYAIESLIYFTAGLIDEFHKQDVQLESAITKYFTVTKLFELAQSCVDIIGPKALTTGHELESAFRNASYFYAQNEALDSLQLFIGLCGLQHAGMELGESVAKSRNPLFNPGHVWNKYLKSSNIDNPNPKLRLIDNLHPSLEPAAQCLENSLARLHMTTEMLLTRHGSTVVERHAEVQRLTKMATSIYAMYASISRASRSYCIGLRLADHELLTASTIAMQGHDRVKTLCEEVFQGEYLNGDNNLRRLSKQVLKSKGHFAVHPLDYNF